MSNNGINNASNGRNSSANSTSITKPNVNIIVSEKSATTSTTATESGNVNAAGTIAAITTKDSNNFIAKTPMTTTTTTSSSSSSSATVIGSSSVVGATHRRDNSSSVSLSNQHHQKQPQQHQHLHPNSQQCKRDPRKYQYVKPQTQPISLVQSENTIAEANSSTTTTTTNLNDDGNGDVIDKEADKDHMLVYYDGNLMSGSLQTLIEHMVPSCDYYPERNFIFSFLLSARLFIRPHELLAEISQTWERQQSTVDVVDEANFGGHHQCLNFVTAASASPLTQRKTNSTSTSSSSSSSVGVGSGGVGVGVGVNDTILSSSPSIMLPDVRKIQRTSTQKSAQNCIRLLSEWIETFPYDFRDERLMQQVRILARKCVYIDNSLGKQVSRILQLLVHRLTALEKYEEFLQSVAVADLNSSHHQHYSTSAAAAFSATNSNNIALTVGAHNSLSKGAIAALNNSESHKLTHPASVSATNSSSNSSGAAIAGQTDSHTNEVFGLMDLCSSCAQLAHQLTAIELERLSHIGPEEFVQAFAKEYQHSIANKTTDLNVMSSSLNDMKKTRNLESYVEWFNRLSYLTASEIVKYPKKKQRVRIIEYWIETARECFNIGNFNSLMAIIAGLNLAPISRLKKTWSKVQSAKFSVLEHQMDPTSNFNSYRSTLKAAMWRSEGATDERERIIIPFFSLFVKDLYFLNEGCSNRLPNNHINFEKCSQLAKQVMEFNEWKKVTCPFEKLPIVIAFLENSPILNENILSMASFECEPPENTEEKGRYKTVKAETKQQLLQQLQEQQLQ